MDWDLGLLVEAKFQDARLAINFGPLVWIGGAAVLAGIALRLGWGRVHRSWHIVEINLPVPGGTCKIARKPSTAQIAHQAYIELVTRKAALPFDELHDSIDEVYDSWYAMFGTFRDLAKTMSADFVRNDEDNTRLLELLVTVLNEGLRPHLTKWQVPFRTWLEQQASLQPAMPKTELQRSYPSYDLLLAELKKSNELLRRFASCLKDMAYGPEASRKPRG